MRRLLNIYNNPRYRIRARAVLSSLCSRSLSGILFKLMRLYVSPHYKRTGYNRDRRERDKDNSCIVRSISANISAMRVQFRGNEANATVTMHPFAQTGTHFARTYRTTASHYARTNTWGRTK